MRTTTGIFLISFLFFALHLSCSEQHYIIDGFVKDGKYDSEFPFTNPSKELEQIARSVRLINSLAFYKQYIFSEISRIKLEDIFQKNQLINRSVAIKHFSRTASGTGTIVSAKSNYISLLTCDHIVNFPDTIISYYSDQLGRKTQFIESISIKTKQTNYTNIPSTVELEVLFSNEKSDVALLGCYVENYNSLKFPPFKFPFGDSDELEWGTFVYSLGMPLHKKMISSGLISKSEKSADYFYTNLSINEGASGGIVLAIRDGAPNLELIGIISNAPADMEYYLKPPMIDHNIAYREDSKYGGNSYIGIRRNIRYGVVNVVGINRIKEIFVENEGILSQKGIYISQLFSEKDTSKSLSSEN